MKTKAEKSYFLTRDYFSRKKNFFKERGKKNRASQSFSFCRPLLSFQTHFSDFLANSSHRFL